MILTVFLLAILQSPGPPKQINSFGGGPNAIPLWANGAPGALASSEPSNHQLTSSPTRQFLVILTVRLKTCIT